MLRRIVSLQTILATSMVAAACGSDGDPSDPVADVADTTDTSDTIGDDADAGGDDVDAADAGVDTEDAADAPLDVTDTDTEDPPNPPTAPLSCGDATLTGTVAPGTPLSLSMDVENTTTTGVDLTFLGREVSVESEITLACATDIVPDDFTAVSPAFTVTSDAQQRLDRRMFVALPFEPSKMPSGARPSSLRVFYDAGEGVFEPLVMNIQEDVRDGNIVFETELFGTYQIGIADDAGTPRDREWTFRAISGVSMGGLGSSMVGARHPERFDMVAPLGGPIDWIYLSHYIRDGGMGGFAPAPTFGEAAPFEVTEEAEHAMRYDDWYFPTGEGTGGSFNRSDYSEIFLDLSMAAGNIVMYNPDSPFRATGMPLEETLRAASERCSRGNTCPPESVFTIESGMYDDEYNPDGSLPVIAFCDGQGSRDEERPFDRACDVNFDGEPDETNEGLYDDPCDQTRPMDITLAVDVNGDGIRQPGEPILRNFYEPYQDVGADGIASVDEDGYDALLNPDPAGDDYDYMNNPWGTEGNWLWDEGEPYDDFGIDGVDGTPQVDADGYDYGEGNGRFDYNPNLQRIFDTMSPRHLLAEMDEEDLLNTNWYLDAGIRDLFNFSVGANQLAGTMQGLGMNMRIYEEFWRMQGLPDGSTDNNFDFTQVDYPNIGDNVYLRYGNIDADAEDVCFGDGKHVGTVLQVANRILAMLGFITNRFPDGDRTRLQAPFPLAAGTFFAPVGDDGAVYRYSIAFPPGYEWTQCIDGRDNDRDGLEDGEDPDCTSAATLSESGESLTVCTDGIDNDADGKRDEDDPDCADGGDSEWPAGHPMRELEFPVVYVMHGYGMTPEDLQVTALPFSGFMASGAWPKTIIVFPDGFCGEVEVRQCNDGIDNDDDGLADDEDPDCAMNGGRSESGENLRFCEDGVDNDRDGLVDGDDGGCLTEDWDTEADCVQGNFYTNHVSYPDGEPGGAPYEDYLLNLMDHIDATYRTREPEVFPDVR